MSTSLLRHQYYSALASLYTGPIYACLPAFC